MTTRSVQLLKKKQKNAAVAQWVRALALQAEGWVLVLNANNVQYVRLTHALTIFLQSMIDWMSYWAEILP